ncbi:ribose-5-phosphate isomerase A [Sulfuracidifex metallicus]|uniref:ribose-5-phosphate isomerase A n=1 Tax=Sulfuracidifex metallicus TaxID=47303 RepID=UPI0006D0C239|nr:ribose-5-phosphate isomerase A [Sulfuracidifex metallicus]
MIKGGGAALFREKILASYSKHRVYIGEYTKIINRNSSIKIPIEVLPVAHKYVIDSLKEKGIEAKPRESDGKIGSVFSDNGNMILDLEIKNEIDLCELDKN